MLRHAAVDERLALYAELLLQRNAAVNLTGARDRREVDEHIADVLSIARHVRSPLVDVGSGGGLVGIPLAIATGARVVLIESVGKKARFLREAVAALDLDAEVVAERAEIAAHEPTLRGQFASATARAVGSAPTVLELTLPFLAPDGLAILQRGALDDNERRATADAALMLAGEVVGEEQAGGGRVVLLVAKRGPTALRFPRRPGVPEKRPLCLAPGGRRAGAATDGR
jgi:16S rRNA (guanine527-N7)-methyltransferase